MIPKHPLGPPMTLGNMRLRCSGVRWKREKDNRSPNPALAEPLVRSFEVVLKESPPGYVRREGPH
jgi:hypothetical protein